jgi:hypothetical protein
LFGAARRAVAEDTVISHELATSGGNPPPAGDRSHEIVRINRETQLLRVGLNEKKVLACRSSITMQFDFRWSSQV